jgi:acyl-coenzyme A synthetase/AMP-(fatty) acid ligase
MNIAEIILRHAWTKPDAEAIIDGARVLTYRDLRARAWSASARLRGLGVAKGTRVGLCLKDRADHLIAFLAVTRLGAIAVPLDWRAKPTENARLILASGAEMTLIEDGARALPNCATAPLSDVLREGDLDARPAEFEPGAPNDLFVVSASSGSTGAPKLTTMSHLQYYFAVSGMLEALDLSGRHRYLATLPLYYSGGRNSCLGHLIRGDCVILYSSLFDAEEYIEVAHRSRATVAVMVPTMLRRLLSGDSPQRRPLPDLAALFTTGAPLAPEEKLLAQRRLSSNFQERFGTAETLVLTVLRPDRLRERPQSVGQPLSLAEVEVVDDDGRTLAAGEIGQLRCRSPGLASPLPGGGAQDSFRDGWFHPGEMARLDELGFLYLHGRASEVIIRSGAKIHPAEIEQVLRQHPRVAEAAVFGRANDNGEGEIFAFVAVEGEISAGDLIAYCRTRLPPNKAPKTIRFVANLPKNTAGKIDKIALRGLLDAEDGEERS